MHEREPPLIHIFFLKKIFSTNKVQCYLVLLIKKDNAQFILISYGKIYKIIHFFNRGKLIHFIQED